MYQFQFLLILICIHVCLIGQEPKKVVLITGASKGIGLEVAKQLSKEGYIVYASYCTSSKFPLQNYPNMIPIKLDVTDSFSINNAIKRIISEQERIDILINNACKVLIGTCETLLIEEQKEIMDVNYFGVVRMLQAVLPQMRKQNRGHIINMSSVSGFEPFPITEGYVASKFALEGLSESLAIYLDKWNIKVTLVEPAGVKTTLVLNAPFGNRFTKETRCFENFCKEGKRRLVNSFDQNQSPKEVAMLMSHILKEEHLHLRYQTNSIALETAKARFIDPTGDLLLATKRRKQKTLLELLD